MSPQKSLRMGRARVESAPPRDALTRLRKRVTIMATSKKKKSKKTAGVPLAQPATIKGGAKAKQSVSKEPVEPATTDHQKSLVLAFKSVAHASSILASLLTSEGESGPSRSANGGVTGPHSGQSCTTKC